MARPTKKFGRWRITSMEMGDKDFVDEEVPGFIEFKKHGPGEFHFGYVRCDIDWQEAELGDEPAAEFRFQGFDELEPTSGRGWTMLEDGTISGVIIFFQREESAFTAKKLN